MQFNWGAPFVWRTDWNFLKISFVYVHIQLIHTDRFDVSSWHKLLHLNRPRLYVFNWTKLIFERKIMLFYYHWCTIVFVIINLIYLIIFCFHFKVDTFFFWSLNYILVCFCPFFKVSGHCLLPQSLYSRRLEQKLVLLKIIWQMAEPTVSMAASFCHCTVVKVTGATHRCGNTGRWS